MVARWPRAAWLRASVFRQLPLGHSGIVVGLLWLATNVGRGLLILMPVTKMSLSDHFREIGLRCLVITTIVVALQVAAGASSGA